MHTPSLIPSLELQQKFLQYSVSGLPITSPNSYPYLKFLKNPTMVTKNICGQLASADCQVLTTHFSSSAGQGEKKCLKAPGLR